MVGRHLAAVQAVQCCETHRILFGETLPCRVVSYGHAPSNVRAGLTTTHEEEECTVSPLPVSFMPQIRCGTGIAVLNAA